LDILVTGTFWFLASLWWQSSSPVINLDPFDQRLDETFGQPRLFLDDVSANKLKKNLIYQRKSNAFWR
jgi:hypothetical protein